MNVKKQFGNKAIRFGVGTLIAVAAVVLIGGCDRREIRVRDYYYDQDNYCDPDITVYPSRSRVYVSDTGPRHRVSESRRRGRHDDGDGRVRSRHSGRTRDRRGHRGGR